MLFRLLLACSLLIWSFCLSNLFTMMLMLIVCTLLLFWRGASWLLCLRSLRLLLWLFVPIIIFHGLFTPGTYIQSPFYLPLSIEGLQRALFLCLHVLLIFFAALSCFRLLKAYEWFFVTQHLPWFGSYLLPYLLLLPALRTQAAHILKQQQQTWQAQQTGYLQTCLSLPKLLLQSLHMMLEAGQQEALSLWSNWASRVQAKQQYIQWFDGVRLDSISVLLLSLGWGILCLNH